MTPTAVQHTRPAVGRGPGSGAAKNRVDKNTVGKQVEAGKHFGRHRQKHTVCIAQCGHGKCTAAEMEVKKEAGAVRQLAVIHGIRERAGDSQVVAEWLTSSGTGSYSFMSSCS